MNIKILATALLSVSACSWATAQDLNSEITVTHDVVPEERAATRLQLLPSVSLPQTVPGRLSPASLVGVSPLTPSLLTLEPAPYLTSRLKSPWRGYASLGYGPMYNLGASAGYRFVERDNLQADAFLHFDGFKYKSKHPDASYRAYGPVNMHRNSLDLGTRATWSPLKGTTLSATATYAFSGYNFPLPVLKPGGIPYQDPAECYVNNNRINANMLNISADWRHSVSEKWSYTLSTSYGLHANSGIAGALTENRGSFGGSVVYDHGDVSHWSMDASLSMAGATARHTSGTFHKGIVTLRPAYRLTIDHFSALAGVRLDMRAGGYNPTQDALGYIYPELQLMWRPSSVFCMYGKMDGHTDANYISSLYESQPYIFPIMANLKGYSHVHNYEIGATAGPWRGAAVTVFAGFATASDWLMSNYRAGYWMARNVAGMHFGLKADYSYRSYLDFSAKLEMATSPDDDFDHGYYPWRDHARLDLDIKATIHPIEPLDIQIGYHLRTHRAKPLPGPLSYIGLGDYSQALGNISDLNIGAHYRINDMWGVFLRGENILNHSYYIGPAVPSQGIRCLAGATVRF